MASSLVIATRVSVEAMSPHRKSDFIAVFSSGPSVMLTASYLPNGYFLHPRQAGSTNDLRCAAQAKSSKRFHVR